MAYVVQKGAGFVIVDKRWSDGGFCYDNREEAYFALAMDLALQKYSGPDRFVSASQWDKYTDVVAERLARWLQWKDKLEALEEEQKKALLEEKGSLDVQLVKELFTRKHRAYEKLPDVERAIADMLKSYCVTKSYFAEKAGDPTCDMTCILAAVCAPPTWGAAYDNADIPKDIWACFDRALEDIENGK